MHAQLRSALIAALLAVSPNPPGVLGSGPPAQSPGFAEAEVAAPRLQAIADAVGPAASRRAIAGIVAVAEATGPRGVFANEIVSLADGTARFRQTKQGENTDLLLAGGRPYRRPGAGESALVPADAAIAGFVRGHEIHFMLLDLERRFRRETGPTNAGCLDLRDVDDLPVTICRAQDSELPATIELGLPAELGGGSTTIELSDWRALHDVRLPFAVDFLHAGERHTYRYVAVLPFRLAPGVPLPTAPDALFERLGDLASIAAAHERVLDAHRRSDVRRLLDDAAERSLQSGRGVLKETGRDELAARLGPYLDGIRFSRYEDVALPALALSADGTLGWLACEIEAAGMQSVEGKASEPIAYGFSWVELYARTGGRWQAIGNASSARP